MRRSNQRTRLGLFGQMVVLMMAVLAVSLLFVIVFFSSIIDNWVERTTEAHALTVAELVSENHAIIDAFSEDFPAQFIQPITEDLRERTGADYIVIANESGVRYSHPHENEIGKPTETSNEAPLAGNSVVFIGDGVLGEAVKAKVPIYNDAGTIIGVSSVGFLTNEVKEEIFLYQLRIAGFGGLGLLIGIPGAFFIARRVKRLIFDLEPEEISRAFSEKQAILDSIAEATLAVNSDLHIMSANTRAKQLFGTDADHVLSEPNLKQIAQTALSETDKIKQGKIVLKNGVYLVDVANIQAKDSEVAGLVLTIRPFSEVEDLATELLEIRQHSDHMRAQTHEYLNKLNTLNGLLMLGRYEEAKALMKNEVEELQQTIAFLTSTVKEPLIVAVLLGKVNRAKELKATLTFDENSAWLDYPANVKSDQLVAVIGNLIDNALEAASRHNEAAGKVHVSFTDFGDELVMDIEDNGGGMTDEEASYFLQQGVSSKKNPQQHGLGLTIMQHALNELNGAWYRSNRAQGGMCMTITVPKHPARSD